MFRIEKKFRFEAGHQLVHHDGICREPHGHSYEFVVVIQKNDLIQTGPKQQMVVDFLDISSVVKPMVKDFLDHKWLNDSLQTDSPTAEFIAKWIFNFLAPHLDGLFAITLYETDTSCVTFFGN